MTYRVFGVDKSKILPPENCTVKAKMEAKLLALTVCGIVLP